MVYSLELLYFYHKAELDSVVVGGDSEVVLKWVPSLMER